MAWKNSAVKLNMSSNGLAYFDFRNELAARSRTSGKMTNALPQTVAIQREGEGEFLKLCSHCAIFLPFPPLR